VRRAQRGTPAFAGGSPAGFPSGIVTELPPVPTGLFVVADAKPSAHFDRGLEVLLVSNLPPVIDVGPPAPPHAQNTEAPPEETPTETPAQKPAQTTGQKPAQAPAVPPAVPPKPAVDTPGANR